MISSFNIKNKLLFTILVIFTLLISGCNIAPEYTDPSTGKPIVEVAKISLLKKSSIKTIYGTPTNVFYVMNNGQLLASGNNSNAILGQGNTKQYDYVVQVKLPERIKNVNASSNIAVAVSDTNNVYIWGDLSWWNIDNKSGDNIVYKKFSFNNEIITDVSVNKKHIAILTKKGVVYTLGYDYGQLGHKDYPADGAFHADFEKVDTDIIFTNIATNATTTYMLSVDGEIYASGKNENNEMGYIDTLSHINKIDSTEKFINIQSAGLNIVALTNSGNVYVCGKNEYGVLALNNEHLNNVAALTQVPFEYGKVKNIFGNSDLNTLYFVTEEGYVYASGKNDGNTLNTQNKNESVFAPSLVKIGNVISFYGYGSTLFYTDSKRNLYTYGNNEYYQMPDVTLTENNKFVAPIRIYANIK